MWADFECRSSAPGGGLSPHEMDCKAFVMSFFLPYPAFLWKL
jgi:hypothetical protein